jgi:tetratricopeptide (TPR) repeat protein
MVGCRLLSQIVGASRTVMRHGPSAAWSLARITWSLWRDAYGAIRPEAESAQPPPAGSELEFQDALTAIQDCTALLVKYEETRDSDLLPALRSAKPGCEIAIDLWLSRLAGTPQKDHERRRVVLALLARAHCALGGAHMYLSEHDEARACYGTSLEIGDEIGLASTAIEALYNLGLIDLEQDDTVGAVRHFQVAVQHLNDENEDELGAIVRKGLAVAEARLGSR